VISFGSQTRVFVATAPVDFRRGVHGLVAMVAEELKGNPYSGDVFVFRSKRADRLKVITHPHFRRADQGELADFWAPLQGSAFSESMSTWIALICSA
jgi:IS66 Orf2 like protein